MSYTRHCIIVLFVALLRTVFTVVDPDIMALYEKNFTGEGTFYSYIWDIPIGVCQYDYPALPSVAKQPQIKYMAALGASQFMDSKACGVCLQVHSTSVGNGAGSVERDFMVFVKDLCVGCREGDIDVIAKPDGRWRAAFYAVPCPVNDTKIEYKFHESTESYLKLQVRNARIPPALVRIKQDGQWKDMERTTDGFWTFHGKNTLPIDVELTAADGEVIQDQVPKRVNEEVLHGKGVQFGSGETQLLRTESAAAPQKKPSSILSTPLGLFVHCICTVFVILSEMAAIS